MSDFNTEQKEFYKMVAAAVAPAVYEKFRAEYEQDAFSLDKEEKFERHLTMVQDIAEEVNEVANLIVLESRHIDKRKN